MTPLTKSLQADILPPWRPDGPVCIVAEAASNGTHELKHRLERGAWGGNASGGIGVAGNEVLRDSAESVTVALEAALRELAK